MSRTPNAYGSTGDSDVDRSGSDAPNDASGSTSNRYGSSGFNQPGRDNPENVGSRSTGAFGEKQSSRPEDQAADASAFGSDQTGDQSSEQAEGYDSKHAPEMLRAHAKTAKRHVEAAASEVKSVAHEAANATRQLRDKAATAAHYQRTRTADVFEIIADAVRDAGKRLLEEPRTREVGIWGDIAADKVTGASNYLRQNDASTMFRDVNQIARKHPELFLGAMATAGLALARFIKASQRHETERLLQQAQGDTQAGANPNASFGADSGSESRYNPTGYTAADRASAGDGANAGSDGWDSAGGRISDAYRPISSAGVAHDQDASVSDPTPTTPDTRPRLSQLEEEI